MIQTKPKPPDEIKISKKEVQDYFETTEREDFLTRHIRECPLAYFIIDKRGWHSASVHPMTVFCYKNKNAGVLYRLPFWLREFVEKVDDICDYDSTVISREKVLEILDTIDEEEWKDEE